jgi:hypothetical protein
MCDGDDFIKGNRGYEHNYLNVYNNTIARCLNGIVIDSHPINKFFNHSSLKNNIVMKCPMGAYVNRSPKSPSVTADCCIGDDDSLNKFVGYSNYFLHTIEFNGVDDFRISLYEIMRTNHINMIADQNFNFGYDSIGVSQNCCGFSGYDIYKFIGEKNYSVGSETGDLSGGSLLFSTDGGIATIVGDTSGMSIGIGDQVDCSYGTFYIAEKCGNNTWFLVYDHGLPALNITYPIPITSIKRTFNNISDVVGPLPNLLSAKLGFVDLVSNEKNVKLWFYKDGEFTDKIEVTDGWITSRDYSLSLLTPYNTNTQCVLRQRHHGVLDGVLLSCVSDNDAVVINNSFITIEGFSIKQTKSGFNAISSTGSSNLIKCNVISDGKIGISVSAGSVAVSNILYGQSESGIDLDNGKSYNNTCAYCDQYGFNSHNALDEIINCVGSLCGVSNFNGIGQFINNFESNPM